MAAVCEKQETGPLDCALCSDVMEHPISVSGCYHSFCRACIYAALEEQRKRQEGRTKALAFTCPSCKISLGAYPGDKLKGDLTLSALIQHAGLLQLPRRIKGKIMKASRSQSPPRNQKGRSSWNGDMSLSWWSSSDGTDRCIESVSGAHVVRHNLRSTRRLGDWSSLQVPMIRVNLICKSRAVALKNRYLLLSGLATVYNVREYLVKELRIAEEDLRLSCRGASLEAEGDTTLEEIEEIFWRAEDKPSAVIRDSSGPPLELVCEA